MKCLARGADPDRQLCRPVGSGRTWDSERGTPTAWPSLACARPLRLGTGSSVRLRDVCWGGLARQVKAVGQGGTRSAVLKDLQTSKGDVWDKPAVVRGLLVCLLLKTWLPRPWGTVGSDFCLWQGGTGQAVRSLSTHESLGKELSLLLEGKYHLIDVLGFCGSLSEPVDRGGSADLNIYELFYFPFKSLACFLSRGHLGKDPSKTPHVVVELEERFFCGLGSWLERRT